LLQNQILELEKVLATVPELIAEHKMVHFAAQRDLRMHEHQQALNLSVKKVPMENMLGILQWAVVVAAKAELHPNHYLMFGEKINVLELQQKLHMA
jgi:hypothetical protein